MTRVDSPRLNACREFGKLAGQLHGARCLGALDLSNCRFEVDGTLVGMFSIGRGRILEHQLTVDERARDLASLKRQLGGPSEWEAIKLGYRLAAVSDVNEVLAHADSLGSLGP